MDEYESTRITPEKWTIINKLLERRFTPGIIANMVGCSDSTVIRIEKQTDMPEYVKNAAPISEEKVEQIKKLLLTMSVAKVAAQVGLPSSAVRRVRKEHNIPIGDDVSRAHSPEKVDQIKRLLLNGATQIEVAKAANVSTYSVAKIKRNHNISVQWRTIPNGGAIKTKTRQPARST
ncbi:hypothetical protein BC940DRAFT_289812 [Gongronella butleri]|nr:hypothetical protein BC940DRAFT_289812 [Gongronella butleri]